MITVFENVMGELEKTSLEWSSRTENQTDMGSRRNREKKLKRK